MPGPQHQSHTGHFSLAERVRRTAKDIPADFRKKRVLQAVQTDFSFKIMESFQQECGNPPNTTRYRCTSVVRFRVSVCCSVTVAEIPPSGRFLQTNTNMQNLKPERGSKISVGCDCTLVGGGG